MKKISVLALSATALLLGACSDSKVEAPATTDAWNGEGTGYMSLSINLPTTPSTRAANDVYDDGLADEYKVQDAGLLLFTGATEATATLMYAQPLVLPFNEEDKDADNDNITTAYQTVAEVKGNINVNLYGLVVLNYKNVLDISGGTAKVAGTSTTVTTLTSLQSTVANAVVGNDGSNKKFTNKETNAAANYFFMTNALLQAANATEKAAAPTAVEIKTLVNLDKSKIYPTEAQAKANPAGTIYVERAVAKATLSASATTIKSGDDTDLNISKVEWAIDNIEPTSFIVRNPGDNAYIAYSSEAFGTTNVYRFVGDTKMGKTSVLHPEDADLYRHYWAIDPQYDVAATGLVGAAAYGATGLDKPQYCNENTFNVANQTYANTTRAVIKVTTDGGTFYTVNSNEKRYSETDAKSYIITDLVESTSFQNKIKGCLLAGHSYTFSTATVDPAASTWTVDAATAQLTIASITLGSDISGADFDMSAITALDFSAEIDAANENFKVYKYSDGVVYYEARFEHFANTAFEKGTPTVATAVANGDLAPWNFWETDPNKPTAANAYPGTGTKAEQNYLGRYGMVRNNWYDVTITAFNRLGSPVDPSGNVSNPITPDDNVKEYISVKIAVLSWAKRTQSWSF